MYCLWILIDLNYKYHENYKQGNILHENKMDVLQFRTLLIYMHIKWYKYYSVNDMSKKIYCFMNPLV